MHQLHHFIKTDKHGKNYKVKSDKCKHSYKETCPDCVEFNTTPQKFWIDANKKEDD